MSALPIAHFETGAGAGAGADTRPDMTFGRMVDDAAALRKSCGYIDFAALRALGWTKDQLDEHGRAAAIEAVRRAAFMDDPLSALSPDEAGAATIAATLLPPSLDLDDEPPLFLHLHAQRMPWRDIRKLAPFIIAKAREQRAFLERAQASDGARNFVSGISL
ncbi:hypothetical+protein [Methylocapsa aurea]|uniref:hypothetical protein n=1 Tax=Methylocapsa aurea TaxID=663610 RepID=UPI003D187C4B